MITLDPVFAFAAASLLAPYTGRMLLRTVSLKRCDRCNDILLWGGERNDVFTKGGGVCERCVADMSDASDGVDLLKKVRAVLQLCAPTELGMFEHQLERIRNGELDDEIHTLKNENRRLKTELDNLIDPNRIS